MKKKNLIIICILALVIGGVAYFSSRNNDTPEPKEVILKDCGLIYDTNFGGAYADITIDEFNALGFKFGDSVRMEFSNGYLLEDLPYYNGYYVDEGDPVLVGYPGYPHIKMGFNYGEDMWIVGGFSDDTTVTISVNEPGKYKDVQESRELHYDDEQGDMSDEKFGNFRSVSAGKLRPDVLIRAASPCDNQHKRAAVVDRQIANVKVNFIINLSDNNEDIIEHINKDDFNSPYFLKLYEDEKVIPLGLTASYKTDDFIGKLINGFTVAAENSGPYFVHCVEGKDRTGYACMLLEALGGASYTEIIDDYMKTYDNYYDITQESDPGKYKVIKEKNIDCMMEYVCGSADYKTTDLKKAVENYLLSKGMSEESLQKLEKRLTATDTVVQEDPMKTILVNTVHTYGFRMNYIRFGYGDKTMVILPGLSVRSVLESAEAIRDEYAMFMDEFTVYVFDRRDNMPDTYSLYDMAEDTAEAFKVLGLKDIYLFGASQGGMMALCIAQNHPELVAKMVLGSSACRIEDWQYYGTIDKWVRLAQQKDGVGLYLSMGKKLYTEEVFRQYEDVLRSIGETVTDKEFERFIIQGKGTEHFDVSDKMNLIKCPTLALHAQDDAVLGSEAGILMDELMKDSPIYFSYTYDGYGHAAFDMAAPEYQQRIYKFFMNIDE